MIMPMVDSLKEGRLYSPSESIKMVICSNKTFKNSMSCTGVNELLIRYYIH